MTHLMVSVGDLEGISRKVSSASVTLRKHIGEIDDKVNGLAASFEGQTAEQYAASIDSWVKDALALMDAVEGLGKFLSTAAKAVRDVDAKLAAALSGGEGKPGGSADRIVADSDFLTSLSSRVGGIADELDNAEDMFDGDGFRSNLIEDALEHFHKSWSDARKAMATSLRAAKDMTAASVDVFSQTDDELTKAISG